MELNSPEFGVPCTACGKITDYKVFESVKSHPHLAVLICKKCFDFYGVGNFNQDATGDLNCRWCADGGRLITCDNCSNAFCTKCIRRNMGKTELRSITAKDNWNCFCCDSTPLKPLRKDCRQVIKYIEMKRQKDLSTTAGEDETNDWSAEELMMKTEKLLDDTKQQVTKLRQNLKTETDTSKISNDTNKLHMLLSRHNNDTKQILITLRSYLQRNFHDKDVPVVESAGKIHTPKIRTFVTSKHGNNTKNSVTSSDNTVELENSNNNNKTNVDDVYKFENDDHNENTKMRDGTGFQSVTESRGPILDNTLKLENYVNNHKRSLNDSLKFDNDVQKTNLDNTFNLDKSANVNFATTPTKTAHFHHEKVSFRKYVPNVPNLGEQRVSIESSEEKGTNKLSGSKNIKSEKDVPDATTRPNEFIENLNQSAERIKESNVNLSANFAANVKQERIESPDRVDRPIKKMKFLNPSDSTISPERSENSSSRLHHVRTSDSKPTEVVDSKQNCKLFISRMNSETTEVSLTKHFTQWGEIEDCVVLRYPDSKKSRCLGFVTYRKSRMVDNALNCEAHTIDGRKVDLKRAVSVLDAEILKELSMRKKLFVGGLSVDTEKNDLLDYFSRYGEILDIRILKQRESGMKRGFAFVEFGNVESVDKVLSEKQHALKGSCMDVKRALTNQEIERNKQGMEFIAWFSENLGPDRMEQTKDTKHSGVVYRGVSEQPVRENPTQNENPYKHVQANLEGTDPYGTFQGQFAERPAPAPVPAQDTTAVGHAIREYPTRPFMENPESFMVCQNPYAGHHRHYPGSEILSAGAPASFARYAGAFVENQSPVVGSHNHFTGYQIPFMNGQNPLTGYQGVFGGQDPFLRSQAPFAWCQGAVTQDQQLFVRNQLYFSQFGYQNPMSRANFLYKDAVSGVPRSS